MSTSIETPGSPFLPRRQSRIGRRAQEVEGVPNPAGIWLHGLLGKVEPGRQQFEQTVRKEITNPAQTAHGGKGATIIDDCLGAALTSLTVERFYTPVDLHVNQQGKARAGEKVGMEAQEVRVGRGNVFVEATMASESSKPRAEATANLQAVEQG